MQLPEFNWTKQGLSSKGTCRQLLSQQLSPWNAVCPSWCWRTAGSETRKWFPTPRTVPEIEIKWCKQQPGSDQQVPSLGVQAYQIWMEHLGCCRVFLVGWCSQVRNKSVAAPAGEGQHGSPILILAFFSPRYVQQAFFFFYYDSNKWIFFPFLCVLQFHIWLEYRNTKEISITCLHFNKRSHEQCQLWR